MVHGILSFTLIQVVAVFIYSELLIGVRSLLLWIPPAANLMAYCHVLCLLYPSHLLVNIVAPAGIPPIRLHFMAIAMLLASLVLGFYPRELWCNEHDIH